MSLQLSYITLYALVEMTMNGYSSYVGTVKTRGNPSCACRAHKLHQTDGSHQSCNSCHCTYVIVKATKTLPN